MPFDPKRPFKVILDEKIVHDFKKPEKKPLDEIDVQEFIKEALSKIPKPKPIEKVIEKQIIKEVEKKETREFAETKIVEELKRQIEELKLIIADSKAKTEMMMRMRGGSGVIGIPPPEPNPKGYVLTVNSDKKAQWQAASGGSGGLAPGTFSISNNTPVYTFDAQNSTIDTLYQTVATLIRKLQGEI